MMARLLAGQVYRSLFPVALKFLIELLKTAFGAIVPAGVNHMLPAKVVPSLYWMLLVAPPGVPPPPPPDTVVNANTPPLFVRTCPLVPMLAGRSTPPS